MFRLKTNQHLLATVGLAVLLITPVSASVTLDDPIYPDASVVVRNYNSHDVQVFAVTEAGRYFELGTVGRGMERTFAVPNALKNGTEPFRLKVYTLARAVPPSVITRQLAGVKTQPLNLTAGERLLLNVNEPLSASFIDPGSATP